MLCLNGFELGRSRGKKGTSLFQNCSLKSRRHENSSRTPTWRLSLVFIVPVRFLHDLHPMQLMFLDNQKQVLFSRARESTLHWRNTTDNVFTNCEIDWSSAVDNESPFIKDTVLIPPALSAQCYHRLLEHFILLYSNPGFSCFPGLSTCSFLNVLPPVSNSAINSLQSPCDCGQELVIVFSTIFGLFFAVVFFFKLF